jgi:hypothetical protein
MSKDGMPLREDLTVPSLGYLKFPKEFVERFDIDKKQVPSPRASYEKDGHTVRLVFEWAEQEIEHNERVTEEDDH